MLERAIKKEISFDQKIYLAFKYGEIEEESFINPDKQEIDFQMLITFSLKLTYT